MSRQRRKRRGASAGRQEPPPRAVDWPRTLALGGLFALVTATPLLPSEASDQGFGVPLAMGWLTLAVVWWAVLTLQWRRSVVTCGATYALVALVAWSLIGAAVMAPEGNARQTINMACQWSAYAALFFTARQLLRGEAEQRGMLLLLLAIAVTLSVHAAHQYFVSLPADARSFLEASEQEQRRILLGQGVDPDAGSPGRRHFVDRLRAREPFATFSLSNSFAAMLAPILALVLGFGQLAWSSEKRHAITLAALALATLLISLALLLTESRTSFLAAAAGLLMLGGWGVVRGRVGWRIPASGAALLLVLLFAAFFSGAIDAQILSSAWKSVQFRLEYWQSTVAMILDYPLLGCGVGNFQAYYAGYKLPQASETVADPHNLLLEVCANAGAAALLALLAVALFAVRDAVGKASSAGKEAEQRGVGGDAALGACGELPSVLVVLAVGAVIGLVLAFAVGGLVDFIPDLLLPVFALPAAVVIGLMAFWLRQGRLATSVLVIALLVLLLNLAVSGSFGYPGVVQIGWLLLAVILNRTAIVDRAPPRAARLAMTVALGVLTLIGLQLAYVPLRARHLLNSPMVRQSAAAAQLEFLEAAKVDVFWDEPWKQLAQLYLAGYRNSGDAKALSRFESCIGEVLKRNQRSPTVRRQIGDWYLAAFRAQGRPDHLELAITAYGQAVERFPNSHGLRAQLAWTLHIAGRPQQALEQARRACEIDDVHPHAEQKLKQLRLFDPGPAAGRDQPPGPGAGNAEQWMLRLRKTQGEAADAAPRS